MRTGRLELYSKTRGYVIIASPAEDGIVERFFAHISKVLRSPEKIERKQAVTFDVSTVLPKQAGHLPLAVNVVIAPGPDHKVEGSASQNEGGTR